MMGKPAEIKSLRVTALTEQKGMVFMLLERTDLPDVASHVKPVQTFDMGNIMQGAEKMAMKLIEARMPFQDNRKKLHLSLTKEEYEKIGSPHIGSQITIQVNMEGE